MRGWMVADGRGERWKEEIGERTRAQRVGLFEGGQPPRWDALFLYSCVMQQSVLVEKVSFGLWAGDALFLRSSRVGNHDPVLLLLAPFLMLAGANGGAIFPWFLHAAAAVHESQVCLPIWSCRPTPA